MNATVSNVNQVILQDKLKVKNTIPGRRIFPTVVQMRHENDNCGIITYFGY